ncbi:MAG: heme ABC transporter ATP-binding protein, partial [Egibacteraceae bacterium]
MSARPETSDDGDRPPAVAARGITKHFPGVVANADVGLPVEHGEVPPLLGGKGAGKTTLAAVVHGLYAP